MKLDLTQLEAAFLVAQKMLENQALPEFMKNRWLRALEKAQVRLMEQPYFSWQPDNLTIVSIPNRKKDAAVCHFYHANDKTCRRLDQSGYCQAFFEGFPCWHRAAFFLLEIYFRYSSKIRFEKT